MTRFALFAAHVWVAAALKLAEMDDDQLLYEPLVELDRILTEIRKSHAFRP